MELDWTYLEKEDRMRLSLCGQADWLVTRCMLLKLLPAWVGISLGVRAPCEQHARAPRVKNGLISCSWLHLLKVWSLLKIRGDSQASGDTLLIEIKLTVDALGAKLHPIGQDRESRLVLTRKESHTLLEMLTQKVWMVGWLNTVQLPHCLGAKP
jgi:hypothetical protein